MPTLRAAGVKAETRRGGVERAERGALTTVSTGLCSIAAGPTLNCQKRCIQNGEEPLKPSSRSGSQIVPRRVVRFLAEHPDRVGSQRTNTMPHYPGLLRLLVATPYRVNAAGEMMLSMAEAAYLCAPTRAQSMPCVNSERAHWYRLISRIGCRSARAFYM